MKSSLTVCAVASESELRRLRRRVEAGRVEVRGGRQFLFGTLHGRDVCLVRTGVGRKNAAAAARAIYFDLCPGLVILAGAAGALDPGLRPGAAVVVDRILRGDGAEIDCAGAVYRRALSALRSSGMRAQPGACFQARTFINRASDKLALHEKTGAHVVDMESFSFVSEIQTAGVPFVDIRVVSDSARRDTADMEALVRLRGRPAAALHLLRHPREFVRACELYRGMSVAARGIDRAVAALVRANIAAQSIFLNTIASKIPSVRPEPVEGSNELQVKPVHGSTGSPRTEK